MRKPDPALPGPTAPIDGSRIVHLGMAGRYVKIARWCSTIRIGAVSTHHPRLVLRRLTSYHQPMDIVDLGPQAFARQFYETSDNPAPQHARTGFFAARDGRKIRYALFDPDGAPVNGSLIVLGGRNEYIEKYFETIGDLTARGFAVATLDWRGQGASDRLIRNARKGYVGDFQHYVDDFDSFFSQIVRPSCQGPYYVLAHSTGALVALIASPRMVGRIQRMVLCAPLLDLPDHSHSMRRARLVSSVMRRLGLGLLYLGGNQFQPPTFAGNVLTSDAGRYLRNIRISVTYPGLAVDGATAAWVHAACRACKQVRDPDFMAKLRIPTLFVAAGSDTVVSNRAIENYARQLKSACVLTIDGARHEILQEADFFREQFLAAFDAFVTDRTRDTL